MWSVVQVLSDLQDRLQPFPTNLAMEVIEKELQASIGDVFSQLSAEPVAAASLGQVLLLLLWQRLLRLLLLLLFLLLLRAVLLLLLLLLLPMALLLRPSSDRCCCKGC